MPAPAAGPRNLRALNAIAARLAGILTTADYETNAGQRVYIGRRVSDSDATPFIVVAEGEETATGTAQGAPANGATDSMQCTLQFTIEGYVKADPGTEGPAIARLKADIKRALLARGEAGSTLGGVTSIGAPAPLEDVNGQICGPLTYIGARPIYREDRGDVEGVEITVQAVITEGYGNPYSAR